VYRALSSYFLADGAAGISHAGFTSRGLTRALFKSFKKDHGLPAIKPTVPFNGRVMPAVRLSGHASFWDEGFKAAMITDSAFYSNPHYHLGSDMMDTLDHRFMAEVVENVVYFYPGSAESIANGLSVALVNFPLLDPFLPEPADELKTSSSAGIPKKNRDIR